MILKDADPTDNAAKAADYLSRLRRMPEASGQAIYATVHQLRRYWEWYAAIGGRTFKEKLQPFEEVCETVRRIKLPETLDY